MLTRSKQQMIVCNPRICVAYHWAASTVMYLEGNRQAREQFGASGAIITAPGLRHCDHGVPFTDACQLCGRNQNTYVREEATN